MVQMSQNALKILQYNTARMFKALNVILSLGINKGVRMDYTVCNHLLTLNGANASKYFE